MKQFNNSLCRRRGFTLIELLVSISIIAILAAIGGASFQGARKAARNVQRKADLREMKTAIEAYNSSTGSYPYVSYSWRGQCATFGGYPRSGSNGYIPELAPDYMEILPEDPTHSANPANCCYTYLSNGTDYKLLARCTPEGNPYNSKDPFYDPTRPNLAWQVHSSSISAGW